MYTIQEEILSEQKKYFYLPHIKFKSSEGGNTYDFSPIKFFKIHDSESSDMYVSIYKLVCGETTSFIPYYMSDGQSNKLRANLLYPFICFNDKTEEYCASSDYFHEGVLFKYIIGEGIDMNSINDALKTKVEHDISSLYMRGGLAATETLQRYIDEYTDHDSKGITSVLLRWYNILDLLIGIFGTSISYYENEQNEINRFIPAPPPNKYNMFVSYVPRTGIAIVEHIFRQRLVIELNNMSSGFKKILLLGQTEYNAVNYIKMYNTGTISRADFNKLYANMCADPEGLKQNASNYVKLSSKFHLDLLNQFNIIPSEDYESIEFKNKMSSVLDPVFMPASIAPNAVLEANMNEWGMKCSSNTREM